MWDIGDEIISDANLAANGLDFVSSVPDLSSSFVFSPVELRNVPLSNEFAIKGAFDGIDGSTILPASSYVPETVGTLNFLPSNPAGSNWLDGLFKPVGDFTKAAAGQSVMTIIGEGTRKAVSSLFGNGRGGTTMLGSGANPLFTFSSLTPAARGGGGASGGGGGGMLPGGGGLSMGWMIGGAVFVLGLVFLLRRG